MHFILLILGNVEKTQIYDPFDTLVIKTIQLNLAIKVSVFLTCYKKQFKRYGLLF